MDEIQTNLKPVPKAIVLPSEVPGASATDKDLLKMLWAALGSGGHPLASPVSVDAWGIGPKPLTRKATAGYRHPPMSVSRRDVLKFAGATAAGTALAGLDPVLAVGLRVRTNGGADGDARALVVQ